MVVVPVVVGDDRPGQHPHAEHHHPGGGDVLAAVAGGLAVDDSGRRRALHRDVGDVVGRVARRDGVDRRGHGGCIGPGTARRGAVEPGAVEAPVVAIFDIEDRAGGVGGVFDRSALDRREGRVAVVGHHFTGGLVADGGGGRDRGQQDGVLGVAGAGYRGLDEGRLVIVGDIGEIGGEVGAGRRPRAVQRSGPEPAAGREEIVALVGTVQEDRAAGVDDPEQAGAGDRIVGRFTVGEDQFRRFADGEHGGWIFGLHPGDILPDFLPVLIGRQRRQYLRQGPGRLPCSLQRIAGGQPA